MNSESASAKFPFSRTPENLVVGVGAGVTTGVGVGVGVVVGDVVVVGVGDVVVVRVGEGEGDAVGVGETVGVGDGDGEGVIVGANVASPAPGQVCDRRIPESVPLIVASDPTWTIRSISFVNVYT